MLVEFRASSSSSVRICRLDSAVDRNLAIPGCRAQYITSDVFGWPGRVVSTNLRALDLSANQPICEDIVDMFRIRSERSELMSAASLQLQDVLELVCAHGHKNTLATFVQL